MEHGKAKRRTQLPVSWRPKQKHEALALELRIDLADQETRFRDYATANAKVYADWDAAFANWIRRSGEFLPPKNGHGHAPAPLPTDMLDWGKSTGSWPGGAR